MNMVAALLVVGIAGADMIGWLITRAQRGNRSLTARVVAIAVWSLLVGAAILPLQAPSVYAPVLVVLTFVWPVLSGLWAASVLGYIAVIAAIMLAGGTGVPFIGTFGAFGYVVTTSIPFAKPVALVAVALFLGLSANLICRGALRRARVAEEPSLITSGGHTQQGAPTIGARMRDALRTRWLTDPLRPGEMRGGRLIGPLERWIIVALALAGAQGIIAALMAAKGIVRFPEISKNAGEGSKAEEFLVGSLISWGLAGAGAAMVAFV